MDLLSRKEGPDSTRPRRFAQRLGRDASPHLRQSNGVGTSKGTFVAQG